jgi:hypothetical protein
LVLITITATLYIAATQRLTRWRPDVPVVVQYTRMYHTTHNISLMTTMAYPMAD